ncbi:restriction endonuclease subunit S, partial [Streptomyces anulatus]|uniref:restriction endonuclease subunit S n=1 Tax=Streptomyces anulatus TaxID=1892 RepID=UPI0034753B54
MAISQASGSTEVDPDSKYPIAGIYSFGRGLIKRPEIQGSETAYQRLTPLKSGQLVMSKLNAWEGAIALVSPEFDGSHVSPEYPVFNINELEADPRYIEYLVAWPEIWEKLTPRGSMVRRKRTTPQTLMELEVPLPDLGEQCRIADQMEAAFGRFKLIRQRRSDSNVAREIFFGSYLREASCWAPLGEALFLDIDEVEVSSEETYPIAGVYGRGRGVFSRGVIQGSETSYKKLHRIHVDSLVMSRLKAFEGAIAAVENRFDGWFLSPEFPTFVVREERATMNYIKHLCFWPEFWRMLQGESKGLGARRERVSADRLLSIQVPLPSLEEQKFAAVQFGRLARVEPNWNGSPGRRPRPPSDPAPHRRGPHPG